MGFSCHSIKAREAGKLTRTVAVEPEVQSKRANSKHFRMHCFAAQLQRRSADQSSRLEAGHQAQSGRRQSLGRYSNDKYYNHQDPQASSAGSEYDLTGKIQARLGTTKGLSQQMLSSRHSKPLDRKKKVTSHTVFASNYMMREALKALKKRR